MLYLIGLGLNEEGYSKEAYNLISAADKVYLENYTIEFPYPIPDLEGQFKKKIIPADRNLVESFSILKEAKNKKIVLLVYGSPLMATTHMSLIQEAKKNKIKTKVIHSASIFDAIAETGLQLYKFGKITSMPSFPANSYIDIIKDNMKIDAHSLILVDIGLSFSDSIKRLAKNIESKKIALNKILVCSRLGNKDSQIYYNTLKNLETKNMKAPFCIIIPGKLHFLEKEILESFNN